MEFRPAPDKHHDAMRLSSGFEQAVVPKQSRSGLVALATEVLDEIAFHLDAVCDVCALGLTCRRLRNVVHPRYTEYRLVRCHSNALCVWQYLAAHPLVARNVRHLHILDECNTMQSIVPTRASENDVNFIGLRLEGWRDAILCAFSHMTTLAKFSWDCGRSGIICFDDISPTLYTCSSLREVEITDDEIFLPLPAEETSQNDNCEFPNLTSVTIRNRREKYVRDWKHVSLDRIQKLIFRCTNLTTLRIEFFEWLLIAPHADDFFLRGRWPSLRTLALQNVLCSSDVGLDAAAAFFAAHPLIETLEFGTGRVRLELHVGTLPRLRHLRCVDDVAAAILLCPMNEGETRPLEVLKGVRIERGESGGALIESLRLHPGLKRIELYGYGEISEVMRLADAAPRVTWLNVGGVSPVTYPIIKVSSVNEWAPVLSALPELTAFHGVRFFYEPDGDATSSHSDRSQIKEKNDEVASTLLRICPKLRRVDCWHGSDRVIVLGKEGNKVNWEVLDAAR